MVGSLLFSYVASPHMDSNIKEWRLFADIANDVGLTLDLVAPMFREHFALVSSLATMCKVRGGGEENGALALSRVLCTQDFSMRRGGGVVCLFLCVF